MFFRHFLCLQRSFDWVQPTFEGRRGSHFRWKSRWSRWFRRLRWTFAKVKAQRKWPAQQPRSRFWFLIFRDFWGNWIMKQAIPKYPNSSGWVQATHGSNELRTPGAAYGLRPVPRRAAALHRGAQDRVEKKRREGQGRIKHWRNTNKRWS